MNREMLKTQIEEKLKLIYGTDYKESYLNDLNELVDTWEKKAWKKLPKVSNKNTYLITYGDSIYEEGKDTLETLNKFLDEKIKGAISDVHLLPMFTYTSDDGFSVVDYKEINPVLGGWNNIEELSKNYRLMFDFVANHASKSSKWFQEYINNEEKYKEYFIPKEEGYDYSKVVRPRTSPLFHEYQGKDGIKTAWSTFSEDQVDVNVKHFPALLDLTEILIDYAYRGGTSIRLDAIGFLWKESGTSCMHLPQCHEIIKLWRIILDYLQENTQIITETNVPHKENISYLGNGNDEAHMVYQFPLPPLTLFTFTTHDSTKLSTWAKNITKLSDNATYFNFLASHDGIGLRPTEGILTDEERMILANKVTENGGKISYKNNTDGTKSIYELNINYCDALVNKGEDDTLELRVQKMLAAHSILLSVIGAPAIYVHSLLGSQNYYKGVEESGINRRINREKLEYNTLINELEEAPLRKEVFNNLINLINIRKEEELFSPYVDQRVLDLGKEVFALQRFEGEETLTFIVNVTSEELEVNTNISGTDIVSGAKFDKCVKLKPYQFVWIK